MGNTTASSADNVRAAMKWSFLHWGFSAWGCYAIVGLALAFFSYSRGLPLTIRSGLTPLFGRALEGPLGHIVDVVCAQRVICRFVGLCDKLADDDPHRMVCGWYWRYAHRQCVGRLAGWLDNLLLGVVDRLRAVCRFVSGPYFEGTHNSGICFGCDDRAVDHVFRLICLCRGYGD